MGVAERRDSTRGHGWCVTRAAGHGQSRRSWPRVPGQGRSCQRGDSLPGRFVLSGVSLTELVEPRHGEASAAGGRFTSYPSQEARQPRGATGGAPVFAGAREREPGGRPRPRPPPGFPRERQAGLGPATLGGLGAVAARRPALGRMASVGVVAGPWEQGKGVSAVQAAWLARGRRSLRVPFAVYELVAPGTGQTSTEKQEGGAGGPLRRSRSPERGAATAPSRLRRPEGDAVSLAVGLVVMGGVRCGGFSGRQWSLEPVCSGAR